MKLPIYLDYQATTPTDPRVVAAMLPYFSEEFGNPHATIHDFGRRAEEATAAGRRAVAKLIGADTKEIVFTSGATEANNLALNGCVEAHRDGRNHLVVSQTEHNSVLEVCHRLKRKGVEVTYLPVAENGLIDVARLGAAIGPRTLLVSVMAVNNEIGVIQPLKEIGALCREKGVLLHTDAAQAVGKIPLDVNAMGIHLLSLSGHKMYGPKGIGALYVRRRPRVRLNPQIVGGGQERGLRSGTLPTPLVVGLGEACVIAGGDMAEESARVRQFRDRFLDQIHASLPGVVLNGDVEQRIPGNLNLGFAEIDGLTLINSLHDVALSAGSACTSARPGSSHVLRALGVDDVRAKSSVRVGIGRFTTEAEIDFAAGAIIRGIRKMRSGSVRREKGAALVQSVHGN